MLLQIQPFLTWTEIIVRLLSVVALIFLNAFFVTVEFSIVSARRSRINQLAATGDVQARTVQKLQQKLNSLLSTTQLGITLSSLALGWIGEHTMAALIIHWLARLPISDSYTQFLSHSIALPLAFLLLAYLQIVLGELCPKSVALSYPEHISRFLGPPSLTIARLLNPFVWLLNQSTAFLLSVVGIKENSIGRYGGVTPEELRLIINTSTEVPELKKGEREILSNVFEFRAAFVEEIMVPRTQIASLPQEATFQDLLDEVVDSNHSRYPITGESLDNILGIVDFRNLALPLSRGELTPQSSITSWITPAKVVPETLPLNDLLTQMQRSAKEMVIVVDEYGGTAGLVTLRDLTAKIIGDAVDADSSGQVIYKDSHTVIFPAQTDIEEVNERLSLTLPTSENYLTLGGFVIFELQKIPQVNEQLVYQDLELTVTAAEGPKLTQIKIRRPGRALVLSNLSEPNTVRRVTRPLLNGRSESER
ncbi:MAG: hemolysin family protein [Cyanobacteria bacterium P01_D01_bin.1]